MDKQLILFVFLNTFIFTMGLIMGIIVSKCKF